MYLLVLWIKLETARKTQRPTKAKLYTRATLDCNTAPSRHQWLITQSLRTTQQPNIVHYGTFCTKESPCEQTPAHVGRSYLHETTTKVSDGLQRHNLRIKCMPRFKTMAQGHDIWHIEAHRWRGMNVATMTTPSTYTTLLKDVHMATRACAAYGGKKSWVGWAHICTTTLLFGVTRDGLWRRVQSYLHTSTNSLRDEFVDLFPLFHTKSRQDNCIM